MEAFLDVHDIVTGEPWQERLRSLIEQADATVFLISPDSVASQVCEWEVNEAELREKRVFPVVTRQTLTKAPLAGTDFNQVRAGPWIHMRDDSLDHPLVMQKVLAEPFPGTVAQGVILVFAKEFRRL